MPDLLNKHSGDLVCCCFAKTLTSMGVYENICRQNVYIWITLQFQMIIILILKCTSCFDCLMQIVTTYLCYKSAILFRSPKGKLFRNCTIVSSTTFLAHFCKWATVNTSACCFYHGSSQHSPSNGRLNCNALMGWILLHLYQELNPVWFLPVRKLNKTCVDEVLHIHRQRSRLCSNSPTSSESKSLFFFWVPLFSVFSTWVI